MIVAPTWPPPPRRRWPASACAVAGQRGQLPPDLADALDKALEADDCQMPGPAAQAEARALERALWLPRALALNGRMNGGADTDSLAIFSLRGRVAGERGQGAEQGPEALLAGMLAGYGFADAPPVAWHRQAAEAESLRQLINSGLSPLYYRDSTPRPAQRALAARLLDWLGPGVELFAATGLSGLHTVVDSAVFLCAPGRVGLFWIIDED